MTSFSTKERALARSGCEVAFDNLTRQLYSTDASIYQLEPLAVAFPRNPREARSVLLAAREAAVPVTPRGAGTGLMGGAIGEGMVIDFARHHRRISELDPEKRTICVEPGVVLDQLNRFLHPHGFCFGPDVATSSRATLGGMIANNSSGARTPRYGTTADHVDSIEVLLADGRMAWIGSDHDTLRSEREEVARLVRRQAEEIERRFPPGLLKRWPGFGLDRLLRRPDDLGQLLAGSEGTLACILSARLRIVPLPKEQGLALVFFATVAEAMQATVQLLDLDPVAIEHVDHVLLDQTKGQLQFKAARDLLELDAKPCESILLVQFFDQVRGKLEEVARRRLGQRTLLLDDSARMNVVWALRKAGLSVLTSRPGPAKPVTGVEDAAVRPEQLPAFVAGLESIMKPLGLEVCYYGHAAAGLLHVRPVLDLHQPEGVRKLRLVADQVSALVRQFRGSIAAEHGVGLARTEYLFEHLGPDLVELTRAIKAIFDPLQLLNPGKIAEAGRYRIDDRLRREFSVPLRLPFEPVLRFARKDHSFIANLEQCNGCGGCRKETPTMCPTFLATGDEVMSTRGRANVIRAVLEGRASGAGDLLEAEELETVLSDCLACKACTTECPSNVNMSLLKAELLNARRAHGRFGLRARLLGAVDQLGRLGCLAPRLANAALESPWVRRALSRALGFASDRHFPRYAGERFDHWFARRHRPAVATRGPVLLWDDTFVRHHEPEIGVAAVRVLEAAGFDVRLLDGRACCGRPSFSQGDLGRAARLGRCNLELLQQGRVATIGGRPPTGEPAAGFDSALQEAPIVFLEPSCYSMFVDDYIELGLPGAQEVGRRCFLFEDFLEQLFVREPNAIHFRSEAGRLAIHGHCHSKALTGGTAAGRLAARIPGSIVTLLETGCCGMAGAFGMLQSKQALSRQVAEPLLRQMGALAPGTKIIASGTSCRHQIEHLTDFRAWHLAEGLAAVLDDSPIVSSVG